MALLLSHLFACLLGMFALPDLLARLLACSSMQVAMGLVFACKLVCLAGYREASALVAMIMDVRWKILLWAFSGVPNKSEQHRKRLG